jgi:dipeptidyl aminopeptidase/acylaminoacyl peptidase
MIRMIPLVILLAAFLLPLAAAGAVPPGLDGSLVEQTLCPPNRVSYERWLRGTERGYRQEVAEARRAGVAMQPFEAVAPRLLSREEYEHRRAYEGFECRRLTYWSDGLRVTAYLWKPKDATGSAGAAGKKLPLILYLRGGNRDFGELWPWEQEGFYSYVSQGYAVLATQYRGVDGGDFGATGDEFGGAELHDVLNLIPLARTLGFLDPDNVFLLGESRGGMETYLALKSGIAANAAAVVSGEADLAASGKSRPEMLGVYRELIPGFARHAPELLRARSVVDWPEKIDAPVLILHGTADWRTSPRDNALAVADKLQALGKTYSLTLYAGDSHGLPYDWRDRDQRILDWFRRFRK